MEDEIKVNSYKETEIETSLGEKVKFRFKELYSNLAENQLLALTFFVHWQWMLCRVAASEVSQMAQKVDEKYPKNIIWAVVGNHHEGAEAFHNVYPQAEMYVSHKEELHAMLKQKKPGLLSFFGLCNRTQNSLMGRATKLTKKDKAIAKDLSTSNTRWVNTYGATLVLDSNGTVHFLYKDKAIGDFPSPEKLSEFFDSYFENVVDPNYPEIKDLSRKKDGLK